MKHMFKNLLIVIVTLGILTGCTLQAHESLMNDDKDSSPKEATIVEPKEPFIDGGVEGVIPFTLGAYPRLVEFSSQPVETRIEYPILIHFETYEEFVEAGYETTFYNKAYFETKGLVLFVEFDHVVGTKVTIHQLSYEDGILMVHANMQRPEVYICLYAPRNYCFAIQYELIKELDSVVGETTQVAACEYFNIQDDIAELEERISHPFMNVEVVLSIVPKGYDNNTHDAYMQEKYELYGLEGEGITTYVGTYILSITYETCTMEDIDRYFSILSDPDIQSISIYVRNIPLE